MAPLTLTYLAIKPMGGRGGTLRFFMLIHGLDFDEELIPMPEWDGVKAKMVETNENPCGTVPVLKVNDDKSVPLLLQHISICRYLFRTKITGENEAVNAWQEMVQDMIADEYHAWRLAWVSTLGSKDVAAAYKAEQLPNYLKQFNALYEKYATSEPYLSTASGKPLWGDVAVASLVDDSIQTGALSKDDLKAYPKIDALYNAFCAIPAIAQWMDQEKKIEL